MKTYRKSRNSMFLFGMRATTLVSLMVAMGPVTAVAAPINVYWTARNAATLNKTDVGSGTTSQLTSTNGRLQDVDLDASTNTLYFADWGNGGNQGRRSSRNSGAINRIQTDGSGLGLVLGGGVIGDAVHQLALDTANNRIYFTQAVSYANREISRVDMNGANYTQLHTGTGFSYTDGWFYSGLAVDVANNALYWGDIGTETPAPPADGAVNTMTLAGAGLTTLVPHVDGKGRGFALDQASQTLFYTAHDPHSPTTGGALYSFDIVNGIETLLISDTATGYWDIEIDPSTNRIWWTDNGRGQIWSANFDGSNPVVELTGLTDVYGLALEIFEPVTVDIRPHFCPNPLNVKSRGMLHVAILGSEDFDVNTIDLTSIRLANVAPIRSSFRDVATPVADANECECTTTGRDGYTDLALKFRTAEVVEELVSTLGELIDGEVLVLTLTGALFDETPIEGEDCIVIRSKSKPGK